MSAPRQEYVGISGVECKKANGCARGRRIGFPPKSIKTAATKRGTSGVLDVGDDFIQQAD
jgi:hypothetical protein